MRTKVLMWIGLGLLAAGALCGFLPLSSAGAGCGSAFVKSDEAFGADLQASLVGGSGQLDHQSSCDSLRSVVRIPAIILLVLGGGLAVAGYATHGTGGRVATPSRP